MKKNLLCIQITILLILTSCGLNRINNDNKDNTENIENQQTIDNTNEKPLSYEDIMNSFSDNYGGIVEAEPISDSIYDLLDKDKDINYMLGNVKLLNTKYYINKNNKGLIIYEFEVTKIAQLYNKSNLDVGDRIKAIFGNPCGYFYLKDISNISEVINNSKNSITYNNIMWFEINLSTKYEYNYEGSNEGPIIFKKDEVYSVALKLKNSNSNSNDYYKISYHYPLNEEEISFWEKSKYTSNGNGYYWQGGKKISDILNNKDVPELSRKQ